MHPKPAGSQQEFPFRFWRSLVRSHKLEPVSTALCAWQHLPKRHWGHKVEDRGQEPGKRLRCAMETWQRGKKSSTISKGIGFRLKTNHVSSFVVKEKQIHSVLGQKNLKRGYLQAFSIQLFLDETIIVKLLIQKYSFGKCQSKIFWVL